MDVLNACTHENRVGHVVHAGRTVFLDDEDLVLFAEFADAVALLLGADDAGEGVKVENAGTQGAHALTDALDALDRVLGNNVTHGAAALHVDGAEIHLEVELGARTRLERDFHDFGFAVQVAGHVQNLAAGRALTHKVILVAGDATHVESLDVVGAVLAVLVNHVVNVAVVVLLELFHEQDVLAHEVLVADLHDLEAAIGLEHDEIVVFGHVEEVFFLLHAGADKAFLAVHVELLVGESHMHGFDLAEFRNLSAAFLAFAVLFQDVLEVFDGVFGDVFLVVLAGRDAFFEFAQKLVGLFTVVMADATNRNFDELADFFVRDFLAVQTLDVGHKAFAHEVDNLLAVLRLLDDLVNFLFDEDFFEGGHVPLVFEVLELVGEFPF